MRTKRRRLIQTTLSFAPVGMRATALPTVLKQRVLGCLRPKDAAAWRNVCQGTRKDCGELETIRIGKKYNDASLCVPLRVRKVVFSDNSDQKVTQDIAHAAAKFHFVRKAVFTFTMSIETVKQVVAFHNLQELDLNPRELVADFGFLGALQQLKKLNVEIKITSANFAHIAQVTTLETLWLMECGVKNQSLENIVSLVNLTDLDLSLNGVNDFGVSHLARLSKLRVLNLSCSRISDQSCANLSSIATLQRLVLSKCAMVGDRGAGEIAKLTGLTHLDMSECTGVSESGMMQLAALVNLTKLNLFGHVHTSDAVLAQLAPLSRLTDLHLGNCEAVTNTGVAHIVRAMPELQQLDLTRCSVSHVGVAHLVTLPRLRGLSLEKCLLVTDESVDALVQVSTLRFVNLLGCPMLTHLSVNRFPKNVLCLMNSLYR